MSAQIRRHAGIAARWLPKWAAAAQVTFDKESPRLDQLTEIASLWTACTSYLVGQGLSGTEPEPAFGMPAWRWATIRGWLQSRGDVSGLRRQVLTFMTSVQGGETSAIRNAMAARRMIGQHVSIGQIWTTLNDLFEEGFLGRTMGVGWTITDKGKQAATSVLSDETAIIPQRMVGHDEPPIRVGRPRSRHP